MKTEALHPAIEQAHRAWQAGWALDPPLRVDEWADQYRVLPESSAEPGPHRSDRMPYLKPLAEWLSARSTVRTAVAMKARQLGFTTMGENWLGYTIHHDPAETLIVQSTIQVARRFSRKRIGPLLRQTRVLRDRIMEGRQQDGSNSTLEKAFPGGSFWLVGANSASGFRMDSARKLFADEVDAWPEDVNGEGDPLELARGRLSAFPDTYKEYIISTPTVEGRSRIDREWKRSDQCYWFVPCPSCGHMQRMEFEQLKWDEGHPETARLQCVACGVLIDEHHKTTMLERGECRPTAAGELGVRGISVSALYAPIGLGPSWAAIARHFLRVKNDPAEFQVFWNTVLARTWEEREEKIDSHTLFERVEKYGPKHGVEVPFGVGVLVAGVDVQGDRLELKIVGYGPGEESWLIAAKQIIGNPEQQRTWDDLDVLLKKEFQHESGRKLTIECVAVDAGFLAEHVLRFTKPRAPRRIYAIRGGNEWGKPLVGRPSKNNRLRATEFTLCVNEGKRKIARRLCVQKHGPGFMHLPDWIDFEYCEQMTSEQLHYVSKRRRGKSYRSSKLEWVPMRERNEAFDLEVYCLAALYILGEPLLRKLEERVAQFALPFEGTPAAPEAPPERPLPRRNWVNGWR